MTVNFQDNENKILKTKNEINKLKNLMRDINSQHDISLSATNQMGKLFIDFFKLNETDDRPFPFMQSYIMKELDILRLTLSKLEGY